MEDRGHTPTDIERRYYTPKEVATILDVSPDTVLRLIKGGRLAALHLSDRIYRIPVQAGRRLLAPPSDSD